MLVVVIRIYPSCVYTYVPTLARDTTEVLGHSVKIHSSFGICEGHAMNAENELILALDARRYCELCIM